MIFFFTNIQTHLQTRTLTHIHVHLHTRTFTHIYARIHIHLLHLLLLYPQLRTLSSFLFSHLHTLFLCLLFNGTHHPYAVCTQNSTHSFPSPPPLSFSLCTPPSPYPSCFLVETKQEPQRVNDVKNDNAKKPTTKGNMLGYICMSNGRSSASHTSEDSSTRSSSVT